MFFAKRNQIKALKQELSIKDRTLADRHQLLAVRNGDLETLKSENQALKTKVEDLESALQMVRAESPNLQSQLQALTPRTTIEEPMQ